MMDIAARQEIREQMKDLNDQALLRLITLEKDEFLPEALAIAAEEAESRNLKVLTAKEYYVQFPDELESSGFCQRCLNQSFEQETPLGFSLFGIGTRLIPSKDECDICRSRVEDLWWCFGSPVRRMARYRVSADDSTHYRRIREGQE